MLPLWIFIPGTQKQLVALMLSQWIIVPKPCGNKASGEIISSKSAATNSLTLWLFSLSSTKWQSHLFVLAKEEKKKIQNKKQILPGKLIEILLISRPVDNCLKR